MAFSETQNKHQLLLRLAFKRTTTNLLFSFQSILGSSSFDRLDKIILTSWQMNKYQGQEGSIILLNMAYTSEKAINNSPLAFTLDLGWGL